jgi:Zn-finger nucleic acid-binding protein
MNQVQFRGIEVDQCDSCGGLWFDVFEHEHLKKLEGSESIDMGDAVKARLHDAQTRVLCPRDQSRMIPMVDLTQPHIWFESCPVCNGAYFDAGEFKDFVNLTFLERLVRRGRSRPL